MSARGNILKYTLLPGILPRIMQLFQSGFMHIAYTMALIYSNVRLLPIDHPYLDKQNIGRYGIRHVIAEAANNLTFDLKNIDQIIIFFTIITGLILLVLQFVLLGLAIFAQHPAYALGVFTQTTQLFDNPNGITGSLGPAQDIAFIILDRVFGVPGIFESCISDLTAQCVDLNNQPLTTPTQYPFPFHLALHSMLQFYSLGIFFVGVFVIIYLVTSVVAETAQTGTPFGQRFNKAWAPVRLILFLALIIPLSSLRGPAGNQTQIDGLNAGQYITLYVAYHGSNFATNAWGYFNNGAGAGSSALSANYLTQQQQVIAQPNVQIAPLIDLIQSVFVAQTCTSAYHTAKGGTDEKTGLSGRIQPYLVRSPPPPGVNPGVNGPAAHPHAIEMLTTNFNQAMDFSYNGNITIRFGVVFPQATGTTTNEHPFADAFRKLKGAVNPYCGEITIEPRGIDQPGSRRIYQEYYNIIAAMIQDGGMNMRADGVANKFVDASTPGTPPDAAWMQGIIDQYTVNVQTAFQNGITDQQNNGSFALPPEVMNRGWAGAGIWYNRIAEMNGAVTTAAFNMPKMSRMPNLMRQTFLSNMAQNESVDPANAYNPSAADPDGRNVLNIPSSTDRDILNAMIDARNYWTEQGARQSNFEKPSENIVVNFLNQLLGTSGIFEMRRNTDVHPLAQLSALGKGMIEATFRNAGGAALTTITSGISPQGSMAKILSKGFSDFFFAFTLASIGIAVILYYVVPFLPFIYFFFAISGWIKSIFEAVIAMPLWALAHLRIDGEGLPGPGASNGYFLLLEIFIRPVLIIFGFLASITIFAACVNVLNQIFDLVVANVGGHDIELESQIGTGAVANLVSKLNVSRGPVDEFFFTAMYAIIVYLLGLSSFKLVDLIPNNILRWMGVSVSTFQEGAGDPAGTLTSNVYRGSLLVGNQVRGSAKGDFAVLAAG